MTLVGDGSFQMTAQDVSTILRYGLTPIILLVCGGGGRGKRRRDQQGKQGDAGRPPAPPSPSLIGSPGLFT